MADSFVVQNPGQDIGSTVFVCRQVEDDVAGGRSCSDWVSVPVVAAQDVQMGSGLSALTIEDAAAILSAALGAMAIAWCFRVLVRFVFPHFG